MKTVYAIARGQYSDYEIGAICLTREVAETILARVNVGIIEHRQWWIDEYPLLESGDDSVTAGDVYAVTIRQETGEVVRRDHLKARTFDFGPDYLIQEPDGKNIYATSRRGYDVAIKAARDLAARFKAEDAGIT